MHRIISFLLLAAFAAAPLTLTACDRKVEEHTKQTSDESGNTKTEKKTVTQDHEGNTTVTKEKTANDQP